MCEEIFIDLDADSFLLEEYVSVTYDKKGSCIIVPQKAFDAGEFSDHDMEVMHAVVNKYGHLNSVSIRRTTSCEVFRRRLGLRPMSRTERTQEMLAHVAAWKDSGKSRKHYCAEHGLNAHTMAYWCAKARREVACGGFSPVELTGGPGLEVCYPNGVRLVLPAGMGMAEVSAYIRLY